MKQKYLWVTQCYHFQIKLQNKKLNKIYYPEMYYDWKKYPEYLGLWTFQTPKAINREFIGGIIIFKKKKTLSWNPLANQLKWPSVDSQMELPGRALRASENTAQPRPIKSVSGNETQASALLKANMQPKLRTMALDPSYSVSSVDQQQDYPLGTS